MAYVLPIGILITLDIGYFFNDIILIDWERFETSFTWGNGSLCDVESLTRVDFPKVTI